MINASDFVSLMTPEKDDKNFKLATVTEVLEEMPIIRFDGEEEPSNKNYPFLDNYEANIGDRVLLIKMAGTYVIIGKVQYQATDGIIVDDGFFKFETIRTKKGLGDHAVIGRRNKPFGAPDRLYNLYVDNKIAKLATREYHPGQQSEWLDLFVVDEGTSVAIAFDGDWQNHRGKYGLVTKGNPYLFWVDLDGNLNKQIWNDVSTKEVLAINVKTVKAIRGWKNINFRERDHGLLVTYIKNDNKIYYRNLCEQLSGEVIWEEEQLIEEFTGLAINVNPFITNDYRTGIMIEDISGKIQWLITERNWVGMAISSETIAAAPAELEINFIPIEYIKPKGLDETITVAPAELEVTLLYADTKNDLMAINIAKTMLDENDVEYEDWGWIVELNIDHPVPNLGVSNVSVTNVGNNTSIQVASIEKLSDTKYKLNISDVVESGINNVMGDLKVEVTGSINPAGYTYIDMDHTFTPINLVPEFIPIPEIEVIYNE